VVFSEEVSVLESCFLIPLMRNSVLAKLKVTRFVEI